MLILGSESTRMSNPYDQLFFGNSDESPTPPPREELLPAEPPVPEVESLDVLLADCQTFEESAIQFAQLLTKVSAVDHAVDLIETKPWLKHFVQSSLSDKDISLARERKYHANVLHSFTAILEAMHPLAMLHHSMLSRYFRDIDEHYYSIHKEDWQVKKEIERVKDNLLLQRNILDDAARDLITLEKALQACELRFKNCINAGGENNISKAEWELLTKQREEITSGRKHRFNYTFFRLNLIDKAGSLLGFLQKDTTEQYLQKLSLALDARGSF